MVFSSTGFQQNIFNVNNIQRVSPHQQQIISNFQQTSNSNNNSSQLSPRQTTFTQQNNSQPQPNSTNWNSQSSGNIRINLQQTNPMLNAQLSVKYMRKIFESLRIKISNTSFLKM